MKRIYNQPEIDCEGYVNVILIEAKDCMLPLKCQRNAAFPLVSHQQIHVILPLRAVACRNICAVYYESI